MLKGDNQRTTFVCYIIVCSRNTINIASFLKQYGIYFPFLTVTVQIQQISEKLSDTPSLHFTRYTIPEQRNETGKDFCANAENGKKLERKVNDFESFVY